MKVNQNLAKFYFSQDQIGRTGKRIEFNLGQGLKTKDPNEVAFSLLIRDYPEIAFFKTGQDIGIIFVPENYIPPNPRCVEDDIPLEKLNLDPDMTEEEQKKLLGQFRNAPGVSAEREVFEGLQQCLKSKGKTETGLVIAGLDIGK